MSYSAWAEGLVNRITRSGCLAEIRWHIWISKSQRSFCASFSWTDSGLCIYHFFAWSNLKFLHNSQWITFPTQSCLVLYSFCTDLLHLLMWENVSSQLPYNLHLLFCCILSVFCFCFHIYGFLVPNLFHVHISKLYYAILLSILWSIL